MTAPTLERAALNNALWCASVVRAGGGATHFAPTLWWSVRPPPRYYPRAITLARALDRGAQQRLERLEPGQMFRPDGQSFRQTLFYVFADNGI